MSSEGDMNPTWKCIATCIRQYFMSDRTPSCGVSRISYRGSFQGIASRRVSIDTHPHMLRGAQTNPAASVHRFIVECIDLGRLSIPRDIRDGNGGLLRDPFPPQGLPKYNGDENLWVH